MHLKIKIKTKHVIFEIIYIYPSNISASKTKLDRPYLHKNIKKKAF